VNAIAEGIDYARETGNSILTLLGMQNEKLDALINKPAPKPLTKYNMVSQGNMLVIPVPEQKYPAFTLIGTPQPGIYWRIDHWAFIEAEIGSSGCQCLAIGDGLNIRSIVDIQDPSPSHTEGVIAVGKSNPQELIIPPTVPLLITSAPEINNNATVLTVSYTSFELTL
jgi:hypothetical protein